VLIEYLGFLQRPPRSFQVTSGTNRRSDHCHCHFHFLIRETSYIRPCANSHKANS